MANPNRSRRYSSLLVRGSGIRQQRWNPSLDGKTFRITRGELVRPAMNSNNPTIRKQGGVFSPLPAYFREAHCMEVNCQHYENGWWTRIPLGPEQDPEDLALNRARYNLIKDQKMDTPRSFIDSWEGTVAVFHFAAEQRCFRIHKIPVERDPIFIHITGPGQGRRMDYNEFFDTHNESSYQLERRGDRHG